MLRPTLLALSLAALLSAAAIAPAQTAYFSGAQTTVASGFNLPGGVAVDSSGNLYVADVSNNEVKEVLAVNGSIPTSPTIVVLGSGFRGPNGVAVDGSGNVYVADTNNGAVKEILAVNGSIPASPTIRTLASSELAYSLALDPSGDLYFSEGCQGVPGQGPLGDCGAVVELHAVNGILPATPIQTNWSGSFSNPVGVAVDEKGNVYVSDEGNNAIKEIVAVNGSVSTTSTIETLYTFTGTIGPADLTLDSSGDLFATNIGTNEVYEVLAVNGSIPTSPVVITLGSGFNFPTGVALDASGNVYVGDSENNRVEKVSLPGANLGSVNIGVTSPSQTLVFTFGAAGAVESTAVLTQGANSLDFANAGNGTCTANTQYTVGQTCTINVSFTPKFAGTRNGAAVLYGVHGIPIATGYLQGSGVGPQVNFQPGSETTVASYTPSGANAPSAIQVDASGNLYITNTAGALYKETLSGGIYTPTTIISGQSNIEGVAVDGAGNVYFADLFTNQLMIETLSVDGYVPNLLPTTDLDGPVGIVVDGAGNVYVSGHVVGEGSPAGQGGVIKESLVGGSYVQSIVPTSSLSSPNWVAVDGSGNLYIADSLRACLRSPE
jgi:sugar lactone lactonase YvrE